jgi:hypothetical protein
VSPGLAPPFEDAWLLWARSGLEASLLKNSSFIDVGERSSI